MAQGMSGHRADGDENADGQGGSRSARVVRRCGWGALLIVIGAGVGWSASGIWAAPVDAVDTRTTTLVEVSLGEVGSSLRLNTLAVWTPTVAGANRAVGTVTTVGIVAGDEVSSGTVLFTVNLRPVTIGRGEVPSFRELRRQDRGEDVGQLQGLLKDVGHYRGPVHALFDAATETAVKKWQAELGLDGDGIVRPEDVIYVPRLPTTVALDETVVFRGAELDGGEPVLLGLPSEPTFTVPVTDLQASLMPVDTKVEITAPNGDIWSARVVEEMALADGRSMVLHGREGTPVCGTQCDILPVMGESLLRSRVITVETVAGLVVPTMALSTNASGDVQVTDNAGRTIPVSIIASAKGMSVIEGVEAGALVQVPS
ncbi:peptidoglycan-binding protein [Nakamurella silvestris]|nr:peptidoglycan-binding protein [Nakamurella silvestris]